MKNLKLFFVIVAGLLITTSCTKTSPSSDSELPNKGPSESFTRKTAITRSYLLSLSPAAREIVYNTLTPAEKYDIWIDKKNQVMGLAVWSPIQTTILNDAYNKLSLNLFTDGSLENVDFKSNFEPTWKLNALQHFNFNTLFRIMVTLEDIDPNYLTNDQFENNSSGKCECSQGSDWCSPIGDYAECGEDACTKKNSGCGTFWSWACDGMCQATMVPH